MATVTLPAPATDIAEIWKVAINDYEAITKVRLASLTEATSIDDILKGIRERNKLLDRIRHDNSKLDKFRTLVGKSLQPIERIAQVAIHATSTVS